MGGRCVCAGWAMNRRTVDSAGAVLSAPAMQAAGVTFHRYQDTRGHWYIIAQCGAERVTLDRLTETRRWAAKVGRLREPPPGHYGTLGAEDTITRVAGAITGYERLRCQADSQEPRTQRLILARLAELHTAQALNYAEQCARLGRETGG